MKMNDSNDFCQNNEKTDKKEKRTLDTDLVAIVRKEERRRNLIKEKKRIKVLTDKAFNFYRTHSPC